MEVSFENSCIDVRKALKKKKTPVLGRGLASSFWEEKRKMKGNIISRRYYRAQW